MSMSRQQLKLVAVLGLGLWFQPRPDPVHPATRVTARRDPSFVVPDSVRALLSFITSIVVDPDSSLYLSDYQLGGIIQLEPSGDFRRIIGRPGSGPGEFRSVINLGMYRDSLWAMDPGLVRLTLMPRIGDGALTVPLGPMAVVISSPARPQTRRGLPIAVLPDGSLLMQEVVPDSSSPGGKSSHAFLLRAGRNLEVMDTLARLTMGHSDMVFMFRDGEAHYGQPFTDDPLFGASADGNLLVTVSREASRSSGEQTFDVVAWRNGRQLAYHREIPYQPRRLPRSVVDSMVSALASPHRKDLPPNPVTADSIRRQFFRPAYYPPVKQLKVARDGAVWLQVNFADSPNGVGDWLVLSPRNGLQLARVTLPSDFRILEANRRAAWGVEGDELDVPQVARFVVPDWSSWNQPPAKGE